MTRSILARAQSRAPSLRTSGREVVDISAEKRHEKELAIAIWQGEYEKTPSGRDKEKWIWLPKSQIEDNGDGTFTMPEWLAKDKGLI